MQEKTLTMNRVLCAVLTVMLMLALVPTYAFAAGDDESFDRHAAMENKTTAEFETFLDQHGSDGTCMFCGEVSSENNGFCGDFGSLTRGDLFQGWTWYEGMLNFSYMGAFCNQAYNYTPIQDSIDSFPADSAFIQWLMGEETVNSNDNSTITIETEASTINVTVPTNAAFIFKSDGSNVYPSNYEITNNNALTAITLDAVDFEGVNGWSLTAEDDTFQADVKKFTLKMGLKDGALSVVDKANGVSFSGDTEIKIAPNGSKTLGFEAKRGVFSSPVTTENAMQMTMHFDWEHAA